MIVTRPARPEPQNALPVELGRVPPRLSADVIRLHRLVFSPGQVACTIYGGDGAHRYLASLASFHKLQPEHELWGAWKGRDLVAYAHFRALPDAWHLNNIAVLPDYQGQGTGSRLWDCFIEQAHQWAFRQVTLDVESDNQKSIDWYARQGLEVTGASWRYEKRLYPGDGVLPTVRLVGWDQAEAWQLAYGFSQFQIHCAGQVWTIGRLGGRYFKTDRPLPEIIEAVLAQIDPSRRLLLMSAQAQDDSGYTFLGKSLRMRGALP